MTCPGLANGSISDFMNGSHPGERARRAVWRPRAMDVAHKNDRTYAVNRLPCPPPIRQAIAVQRGNAAMKICWFDDNNSAWSKATRCGRERGAEGAAARRNIPPPKGDLLIANLARMRAEIAKVAPAAKKIPVSVRALSQPGRQPDQDHRRAGELPQARRGSAGADRRIHRPVSGQRSRKQGLFLKVEQLAGRRRRRREAALSRPALRS